jgi:hypothetical protein
MTRGAHDTAGAILGIVALLAPHQPYSWQAWKAPIAINAPSANAVVLFTVLMVKPGRGERLRISILVCILHAVILSQYGWHDLWSVYLVPPASSWKVVMKATSSSCLVQSHQPSWHTSTCNTYQRHLLQYTYSRISFRATLPVLVDYLSSTHRWKVFGPMRICPPAAIPAISSVREYSCMQYKQPTARL